MLWIIFALLSAFFAALVAILGKIGLGHIDTTLATTIRAIVMALALIIFSLVLGKFNFDKIEMRTIGIIVLTGLAGALSWLFYFGALRIGPATAVAAIDRLSVVFVLLLAVFFLGETLSWRVGFGALLVVSGAILLALP